LFKNNSVIYNGSFINNSSFPSIGYSENGELSDDDVRKSTALNQRTNGKSNGLIARKINYISTDSDWVTFETTVSTWRSNRNSARLLAEAMEKRRPKLFSL
jgi:ABC-2 type transport system permease protein